MKGTHIPQLGKCTSNLIYNFSGLRSMTHDSLATDATNIKEDDVRFTPSSSIGTTATDVRNRRQTKKSEYLIANKKTILIVDDESDVALTLKIILEENGYEVDLFNDPISALTKFEAGQYDLLILDMRMPQMEGYELYYNIRKIDDKVKVLFLSTSHIYYSELKRIFPTIDENPFVLKPVEKEELINQVSRLIGS
jgi:CheY-like chemotaxis protein